LASQELLLPEGSRQIRHRRECFDRHKSRGGVFFRLFFHAKPPWSWPGAKEKGAGNPTEFPTPLGTSTSTYPEAITLVGPRDLAGRSPALGRRLPRGSPLFPRRS